jgi:hypothetical protein
MGSVTPLPIVLNSLRIANVLAPSASHIIMDSTALLDVWKMNEIPACDEGMKLARVFLVSCGRALDRLGFEEPADRITEITSTYMALVEHGDGCDTCNDA